MDFWLDFIVPLCFINKDMILEIYLSKLIIYCVITFFVGMLFAFATIHGNVGEILKANNGVFDFFLVFKNFKLLNVFFKKFTDFINIISFDLFKSKTKK